MARTLVSCLVVPREDDEPFLSAARGGELYRALRDDVEFRYVAIGPVPALRWQVERGEYEVVQEDGRSQVAGGVTLVDPFAVPAEHDEEFMRLWRAQHDALAQHRGYLGSRLYRTDDATRFRHIEVARWSSPLMVARAMARTQRLPALYVPVVGVSS